VGAFEGQTRILGGQDRILKKVLLFAHAVVTGLSPPPPPREIRPLSEVGGGDSYEYRPGGEYPTNIAPL
jgi:hypothetical protein